MSEPLPSPLPSAHTTAEEPTRPHPVPKPPAPHGQGEEREREAHSTRIGDTLERLSQASLSDRTGGLAVLHEELSALLRRTQD